LERKEDWFDHFAIKYFFCNVNVAVFNSPDSRWSSLKEWYFLKAYTGMAATYTKSLTTEDRNLYISLDDALSLHNHGIILQSQNHAYLTRDSNDNIIFRLGAAMLSDAVKEMKSMLNNYFSFEYGRLEAKIDDTLKKRKIHHTFVSERLQIELESSNTNLDFSANHIVQEKELELLFIKQFYKKMSAFEEKNEKEYMIMDDFLASEFMDESVGGKNRIHGTINEHTKVLHKYTWCSALVSALQGILKTQFNAIVVDPSLFFRNQEIGENKINVIISLRKQETVLLCYYLNDQNNFERLIFLLNHHFLFLGF
jgi:hypothetical protein